MKATTFGKFREILYGALFGLGAAMIDIVMHARMHGEGIVEETLRPGSEMALYRVLYFVFGVLLGWALWRRNSRERGFRLLLKEFCDIIDLFDGHAAVIYADAQMLLMQETSKPPEGAAARLGVLHRHMQQVRVLTQKLSELAHV